MKSFMERYKMFKCDRCGKITKPREICNKIISEERNKTYYIIIAELRRKVEYFQLNNRHV